MTDESDEDIEYIAMCYDSWGRGDVAIDALVGMIVEHGSTFSDRGDKMKVAFHKGRGLELEFAHGQALVKAEEKIADSVTDMNTETLELIYELQQDLDVEAEALIRDSGVWEDLEDE